MSNIDMSNLEFEMPKHRSNVIKVIGVGGGGSNAVNHMFSKGISGVDFVVCNTDSQALHNSPVPNKIQLGVNLTEGLGAGADPAVGEEAAKESIEDIRNMLNKQSKMLFITVGMGGGTGTGAAPVIAKVARELDILTVGIVTTPFTFEGKTRNQQAQIGIEKLRQHVDSLVVINNNKLREVYGNLGFKAGFSKADEVLSTAAMGIAQVITHHYLQNIDLRDAKTVLANSGTAIMGSATASGTNRAEEAIRGALDSPLLNDNKITGAKKVLLLIVSGANEVTIDEIGEINDFIQSEAKTEVDIIMGIGEDETLGDSIAVTVIATGFNSDQQAEITTIETKRIIHTLDTEESKPAVKKPVQRETTQQQPVQKQPEVVRHQLEDVEEEVQQPQQPVKNTSSSVSGISYIKNETTAPEVSHEEPADEEDDFLIFSHSEPEAEKEPVKDEKQIEFTFDLPISEPKKEEAREETKVRSIHDFEVVDHEVVTPEPKAEEPKIMHTLELEDEFAPELKVLNELKNQSDKKEEDEDLKIELKVEQKQPQVVEEPEPEQRIISDIPDEEVSPLNLTISELKKRADERRRKMKGFNYKFVNRLKQNIDEIENQPAYKRMGVDIESTSHSSVSPGNQSRTTLDLDENNDIQLRSNNSFLHDNVD